MLRSPHCGVRYGYTRDTKLFHVYVFTDKLPIEVSKNPDDRNYIKSFKSDTQVDNFADSLTLDNYDTKR